MPTPSKLEIKAALKIQKSSAEVFDAIVDPQKMKNYFIATSTGRIEEGKTLMWKFPEFDMVFPVRIGKVTRDKYISWQWTDPDNNETLVEVNLEPKGDSTMVLITEKSRDNDEKGIAWFGRNTEGWANFLACLKAWMEYGINLRKGAFDISQLPVDSN